MLIVRNAPKQQQPEEQEAPVQERVPRFGVALFDESRTSGWACHAGGQPFRFRQPEDLANDNIWVTSKSGMDLRAECGSMAHLRPADYLSKLHFLAADYGLRVDGEGKFGHLAKEACSILAPTIHRTVLSAAQVYGWKQPSSMLIKDSLQEELRAGLVEPPKTRAHMRSVLAAAYQRYSAPSWGSTFNAETIYLTLRLNRLEYAKRIMSVPVPEDHWQLTGEEGGRTQLSLEDCLQPDSPCLVNATVEFSASDPEMTSLCAFGSETFQGRRGRLRTWISQPELMWLVKYARVTISAAWTSSCAKPLPFNAQLPELLTSDPTFALSIPMGLVAEAHWTALASPQRNWRLRTLDKNEYSIWAVWLRAWDRALSFQLALAAYKAGFHVVGYGGGSVGVRARREQLPQLLDFCEANEVAHPVFQSIFKEHGFID